MAKVKIQSEYTAQASIQKPNKMMRLSLEHLLSNYNGKSVKFQKVADQGCGKLRHLPVLLEFFEKIFLIDQSVQLCRKQNIFGINNITINDYIKNHCPAKRVLAVSSTEFSKSNLRLDVVVNICTFDVVLPNVRKSMLKDAYRNLKKKGLLVLIVPRNDQSITKRCNTDNRYCDGYLFNHHNKINTFFKNFKDHSRLIENAKKQGFTLFNDLSVYRHVCLIFTK